MEPRPTNSKSSLDDEKEDVPPKPKVGLQKLESKRAKKESRFGYIFSFINVKSLIFIFKYRSFSDKFPKDKNEDESSSKKQSKTKIESKTKRKLYTKINLKFHIFKIFSNTLCE